MDLLKAEGAVQVHIDEGKDKRLLRGSCPRDLTQTGPELTEGDPTDPLGVHVLPGPLEEGRILKVEPLL